MLALVELYTVLAVVLHYWLRYFYIKMTFVQSISKYSENSQE